MDFSSRQPRLSGRSVALAVGVSMVMLVAFSNVASAATEKWYPKSGCQSNVCIRVVHFDAAGNDWNNLKNEYIVLKNWGPTTKHLSSWKVKDYSSSGALNKVYKFPAYTKIPPGGTLYLHVGKGTNTATHKYWGLSAPILHNSLPDKLTWHNSVGSTMQTVRWYDR